MYIYKLWLKGLRVKYYQCVVVEVHVTVVQGLKDVKVYQHVVVEVHVYVVDVVGRDFAVDFR